MANGPRVRQLLVTEDLRIPDNTWFVGAQRNTCNKAVTLYDDDLVPEHRRFKRGTASMAAPFRGFLDVA